MSKKRFRLFRYRIDVISILVVLLAVGVQLAAFLLKWPWYACVPVILLMRFSHLVEHNHAHLPIFYQPWLNEVLGWITFLNGGCPLEAYRVQHVQTHHKFTNRPGDWTSPFSYEGGRFPDRPVSLFYYVLTYSIIAILTVVLELLRRPRSLALRRFLLSVVVVCSISGYLIYLDPWRFLLFYYGTWWATYLSLPILNWQHHDGCEYRDPYTSANVHLGFFFRAIGFNIGYHSLHHAKPTLHWSLLPRVHWARFAQHVPERYYNPVHPSQLGISLPDGSPKVSAPITACGDVSTANA